MKPVRTYTENDVTITVYPEKEAKHTKWQKNDTFYGQKMRITDDRLFATFTRKAGKA
jgi:hypothetical protein